MIYKTAFEQMILLREREKGLKKRKKKKKRRFWLKRLFGCQEKSKMFLGLRTVLSNILILELPFLAKHPPIKAAYKVT